MKLTNGFFLVTTFAAFATLSLTGCASMSADPNDDYVTVTPDDEVYTRVEPFNPEVRDEISQSGLDPDEVHNNLEAEIHYQHFLHHHHVARDSASATVRVNVAVDHLRPGTGNNGSYVAATVTSQGNNNRKFHFESRQPPTENAPKPFMPQHVPRAAATQIMNHVRSAPTQPRNAAPAMIPPNRNDRANQEKNNPVNNDAVQHAPLR